MRRDTLRNALFLDRDGTLIDDVGYLGDPAGVRLIDGVVDGLRSALAAGLLPIIASNQSGVARGMYDEQAMWDTDAELRNQLSSHGVELGPSYYCVHGPDDQCTCRKPLAGLLTRAADDLGIDLDKSFMVGDKARDVDAGLAAGCRSFSFRFDHPDPAVDRVLSIGELVSSTQNEEATHGR